MVADGLVIGASGNLSVRVGDLIAVTPSGVPYDEVTADTVAICRLDGAEVDAPLPPTTELPMHLLAYERTAAYAVVHTHSTAATAVSTLVDELPSVHYLVAMFGGPVRVAAYATYGTPELAANVAAALDGRTGCLLANHGTLTVGDSLAQAYARAQYLEWLCDVWLRAQAVGSPRLLSDAEIARVVSKLATYGPGNGPEQEHGRATSAGATPDPA
jgi:L-fuculose-phosphate aldolase